MLRTIVCNVLVLLLLVAGTDRADADDQCRNNEVRLKWATRHACVLPACRGSVRNCVRIAPYIFNTRHKPSLVCEGAWRHLHAVVQRTCGPNRWATLAPEPGFAYVDRIIFHCARI
jgi:hypothetical protein